MHLLKKENHALWGNRPIIIYQKNGLSRSNLLEK